MIKSKQKAICHTAPYRSYFIELLPLFPQETGGARASLRYLCARRRLQVNGWLLVRAPPTKCRVGHRNEPNAGQRRNVSSLTPRASPPSSWFSSADSQRLRMFKNTAMRTPGSERHRAGASRASSGRNRPGSVVGVYVNGWRIATVPGTESWSPIRRLVIEKQAGNVDLVAGGPVNGINRFACAIRILPVPAVSVQAQGCHCRS